MNSLKNKNKINLNYQLTMISEEIGHVKEIKKLKLQFI